MGFFTAFSRILMDMTVVTVILLYLPGLPPNTTFDSFNLSPPPIWSGPLKPNEKLNLVDVSLCNLNRILIVSSDTQVTQCLK